MGSTNPSTPASRKSSISGIQTRSDGCPFSPGIVFERSASVSPRSDDDLIFVAVRVASKFQQEVKDGRDELPSRQDHRQTPPKRSLFKRWATRFASVQDDCEYKAIKIPRHVYKQHFARDAERNYVGTEPERDWTEEDLMREFGFYQDVPLGAMHC
ncbi:hypothetical protein BAUCODRAFT_68131 [Baudoinia panamericana UAMH 10762]|uniref:Uncharacterized protein n=1 Tax=Baudoinia panamericana (strain UAMH 10762) TaxID=717646 RepID=M2MK71_BAUPA|nr:uncharacterized protein BAUCODRAFT_68131 [Baudoinia panamericana UAMH 10762]EMC97086.1 hypothetical protein BAUCODRAFT_68131 [Baudoinia panamericana UAMH 10762]